MGKVMIITNHSFMLWQFRRELIQELRKSNEVVISTPFSDRIDAFINMGCQMIETEFDRRSINPLSDLELYRFYLKILMDEKPDIVITYSIKPNIYGGYACSKLHIPYCSNVQGLGTAFQKSVLSKIVSTMYRMALKEAKVVFFENRENADTFIKRKIISENKICVLQGAGVNLDFYALHKYPQNEKVRFLFLGRIMKEKGVDELFEAARMLHKENCPFILDLVGFFEDEYQEQVEELQKSHIAMYHGFQADPRPFYQQADCVILPSYHEGMSNVLLEASAIGRPIITSDISGCREAVNDNKNGFVCRVGNTDDVLAAMRKIIATPRHEREEMGIAGRNYATKKFDKKIVVDKTFQKIFE